MTDQRAIKRRKRKKIPHASSPIGIVSTSDVRDIPAYELVRSDSVEKIDGISMNILEETGVEFRDETAIATWRAAGADVSESRVKIPRELLREKVSLAPAVFTQHARNPARTVKIGGAHMAFAPIYGSPFVRALDGERRYARLADFEDFVKLTYLSPALNHSGGTVCEPTDIPIAHRHLEMLYAHMRWSDKPFMGNVTSAERAEDCLSMCRILFEGSFPDSHTVMTSLTNCNSPLVWDGTTLSVIRVYAEANQACIISPFIMQGANTPVTTAGAFALLNAEALAGIAYAQLVRPGAPVIYGATLSTASMQTGSPMYGTAETQQLTFLTGQMARYYGLPMRTGGMRTGSKTADAQSAYESVQTMLPAVIGGGNFFLHAAGWLESGLSACFAKFVMDADQLIVLQRLACGLDLTADAFAMDAVHEVDPGGHFFGSGHTLQHYRDIFFSPETADQATYEEWLEGGSVDAYERALRLAAAKLETYHAPPLEQATEEALREFIAMRKTELPDGVA
ncbi:MAG: trimethylamine methyltransferase family protein [Arenicellales bacterium]|nr:trimethylamine methyltransferase family protein [Arenicellales bacterium]MDP6768434.1 trimethylamine methyltransferase family protein [Arenicellales bacterium]